MRTVEQQLQLMMASVVALEPLDVSLLGAQGCVLATDVTAEHEIPAFDTVVADGYAVRAADLAVAGPDSPVTLRVLTAPLITDPHDGVSESATLAVKVSAGRMVPVGADVVVSGSQFAHVVLERAAEGVDDEGSDEAPGQAAVESIVVTEPVEAGCNIRLAGSDVPLGRLVVPAGTEVGARELAGIVAAGRSRLRIHPRPRVVVVTSGDELVEAGQLLRSGQVHDVAATVLIAAANAAGAVAYRGGPSTTDPEALAATVLDQLVRADLVVVAGPAGSIVDALDSRGAIDFTWTAVEPGPMIGFGKIGGRGLPIITIPVEPTAALIAFEVFVRPIIRLLAGHHDVFRPVVRATLTRSVEAGEGIRRFVPSAIGLRGTQVTVAPLAPEMNGSPVWLRNVNALAIVPEDVTELKSGDRIAVIRLDRD